EVAPLKKGSLLTARLRHGCQTSRPIAATAASRIRPSRIIARVERPLRPGTAPACGFAAGAAAMFGGRTGAGPGGAGSAKGGGAAARGGGDGAGTGAGGAIPTTVCNS